MKSTVLRKIKVNPTAIFLKSFTFESNTSLLFSATEYHLGLLKAKLAKYRSQLLEPTGKAGAKGEGFDVMKSGDARVALIGFYFTSIPKNKPVHINR
jgi:hypothetical protein